MAFRREYKLACGAGVLQIIGSHSEAPEVTPYLRIEDAHGRYIGSLDGASLNHFRNALDRSLHPSKEDKERRAELERDLEDRTELS